jgi:hypothetical protein
VTVAVAPGPAPSTATRWILSARQDLFWFQGSVLAGVALLLFFRWAPSIAPHAALAALLVWGILFDGTHVVGTYARSYLAPDRDGRAGLPGIWSGAFLVVGPALALLDHLVFSRRAAGPIFQSFLLAALLWAYFHLVRQHWGFVALYRRRAPNDPSPARLDEAILWLGCLIPLLRFSLGPAYAATGLPQVLSTAVMGPAIRILDGVTVVAALVLGAAWIRAGALRKGQVGPKHLLMAIVIAFHAAVFALLDDLLQITAVLTIFHNLQYHRIVWQHESGKGRKPLGGLFPYLLVGLALGVAWYGPRVLGAHLVGPGLARNVLLGLGWGVAFHHYLVDGRIWRMRKRPAVARAIDAGARP